jgi:hypothetical protein
LDVIAGLRVVTRDLRWVKDMGQPPLRPFSMPGAAAVGFQLAWYPAAHFSSGWASNLGIAASGEFVPSVSASTSDGAEYPASDNDYWAGVRGRLPLGALDAMLTVGGGQHAFLLKSGSTAASARADLQVPDVRYTYVRVGLDGRVHLPARFSLQAGAAYRSVLSAGNQNYDLQSSAYFPKATVNALDASASIGWRFVSALEVRAGGDFRRYGLDMHPAATDQRIVSGGIDHYFAGWVGLAVLLDGRPRGAP